MLTGACGQGGGEGTGLYEWGRAVVREDLVEGSEEEHRESSDDVGIPRRVVLLSPPPHSNKL